MDNNNEEKLVNNALNIVKIKDIYKLCINHKLLQFIVQKNKLNYLQIVVDYLMKLNNDNKLIIFMMYYQLKMIITVIKHYFMIFLKII